MAFLSVLIKCCTALLIVIQLKGDPAIVRAISPTNDPPTNIMTVTHSLTSISVTWDPPASASLDTNITYSYNISYDTSDGSVNKASVTTSETMIVLDNLEAGTEYSITVQTLRDGVPCGSAQVNATTLSVPGPPSSLKVDDIQQTSITLSWTAPDAPNGIITQYELQYWRSDSSSFFSSNITDTNSLMHTIEGLIPGAVYAIQLRAYTQVGAGPFISQIATTIPNDPPVDVTARVRSRGEIEVTWNPPTSVNITLITSYNVLYDASVSFVEEATASTTGMSIILDNLEDSVLYTIRVQAVYGNFPGLFSGPVRRRTRASIPGAPPANVNVMDIDPAMLRVTYDEVPEQFQNGMVSGYVVRYVRVDANDSTQIMEAEVDGRSTLEFDISGLVAFTNYSVMVAAVNPKGMGPFSDAIFSMSGQDTPSAPSSLVINNAQSRSIMLLWTAPDTPNGIITSYELQYERSDSTSFTGSSIITDPNTTTYTINGLMPTVTYVIRLRAHTRVGAGPFINQTSVTEPGQPDPVLNVSVPKENISSSTLTMYWMEASEQIGFNITYIVFYQPVNDPYGPIVSDNKRRRQVTEEGEFTMSFAGSPGTLTNLNGSVTYKIQVAAIACALNGDQKLTGNRSMAVMVNTSVGTPTLPRQLNHGKLTKSSIFIVWQRPDPPNGLIYMYTVSYTSSLQYFDQVTGAVETFASNDATNVSVVNESTLSINITDLRAGKEYQITVVAYTSAGPGAPASLVVSTLPDAPPDPLIPQVSLTTDTTTIIEIQRASDINGPIQYFAIIVVIGSDTNTSISNEASIGPYNKAAANQARSNKQPYAYIAGIVRTSDINYSYPYSYMLGDGSMSNDRGVNYVNMQLQAGTQYIIVIRAHTTDDLFANSAGIMVTTRAAPEGDTEDDVPLAVIVGAAVGGVLAIVVIIIVILLLMYCLHKRHRSLKNGSKASNSLDYSNALVLKNVMHDKYPDRESVATLSEDYVGIEGRPFTFPSYFNGTPKPDLHWYLNGRDALKSTSATIGTNGQLVLSSVERCHEGQWTCQASNTFGRCELEFKSKLTVKSIKALPKRSPVSVKTFGSHVNELHANKNQPFIDQFKLLYNGKGLSRVIGAKSANTSKNRFQDIVAYDGNRIALTPFGKLTNEYINASPIDGYEGQKHYIATQGPTDNTLNDFWRLIWQERPPTIVMVTNLVEGEKTKCAKYWPKKTGQHLSIGPFNITMEEEQIFADYVIRKLQLMSPESSDDVHKVTQFHFTAWPDHGVPEYATAILMLRSKVVESHNISNGPLLVHCSAGVGRTGTFIAIDISLKQIQKEGVVDIFNAVGRLRYQRPLMVQTLDQYMFIHDAILESITCGNTQISTVDLQRAVLKLKQKDQVTNLNGFEQQLKVLEQVSPKLQDQVCTSGLKHPKKNRPGHCLPAENFRVILKNETPNYINASYVKGYKQNKAFIVAQSPMENTIKNFWRMIYNLKCATIVMLCELMEDDQEVCAQYWRSGETVTYEDNITVTNTTETHHNDYTMRVFQVTDIKTKGTHQVTQLHYHGWDAYKTPSSSVGLLNMIEAIQRIQRRTTNKPIVVHCSNSIGRSGTFCVLFTVLEKVKAENVADIFQTVKLLRIQRPGLVEDLDQYCFIFSAALQFLQSFETYANFA